MSKTTIDLFKRLTQASGASGYEQEIADVIAQELKGIGPISYDKTGSLICAKKGTQSQPKIMVPGHMDEVSFMVKSITDKGFIKFTLLGGWMHQQLPSQLVDVHTNKGKITGVIGSRPPHHTTKEERSKTIDKDTLFIDVGAKDKKHAEKIGVRPGDPIIPKAPFIQMANPDYFLTKAWDDRAGCALFIEVLKSLRSKRHPNTVYGVGTTQEEIGVRGARTSTHKIDPDLAFVLDVSLAEDVPGGEAKGQVALGKGPVINLYDAGMIPNLKLRDFVIDIAERKKIPYQFEIDEGAATDGMAIHVNAEGVPSIYIGVPARYIHSHAGIIDIKDFNHCVNLVTELIMRLDTKKVKSFSR